jgi:hypothetical protein
MPDSGCGHDGSCQFPSLRQVEGRYDDAAKHHMAQ